MKTHIIRNPRGLGVLLMAGLLGGGCGTLVPKY